MRESTSNLFQDRQTVNVLVLELATMVVAISIAFTSTFLSSLAVAGIVSFVFTNTIVIWFWWGYVVDRLEFPPKTMRFPLLDVLILILISLIPFTLRQGELYYIAGIVGVLVILWAFLIRLIIQENDGTISIETKRQLDTEVRQRLIVGPAFVFVAMLDTFSALDRIALPLFVLLVLLIIGWNVVTRRRREASMLRAKEPDGTENAP